MPCGPPMSCGVFLPDEKRDIAETNRRFESTLAHQHRKAQRFQGVCPCHVQRAPGCRFGTFNVDEVEVQGSEYTTIQMTLPSLHTVPQFTPALQSSYD